MFVPPVHRLQDLRRAIPAQAIHWRCLRTTPAQLVERLPELGGVLYVPMRPDGAQPHEWPRGLLVDTMQLAPLLQTRRLAAAGMITSEGPREWIECLDREGRGCVRLHLLPDTDYLAWDRLLEHARVAPGGRPSRRLRQPCPVYAKVLRFHARRLAGLVVLGAEPCLPISPLGRQVAGQIARAEAVPLQLAHRD
ncbi:hypothetical protein ABNK63_03860 [Rhodanobacter sp. IGA1.0]|uniref:Uncharacterized protein n=1 Tax=Rhodanobacter sp. IGA1.0 TaxID=3158582 RepID=A0AAU7QM61_9GAMM